jgi:protein-S-isoprenylcysteine O-methyltransferase Ste14
MSPFNHRSVWGILAHVAFLLVVGGQIALVFVLEPLWNVPWLRWAGYAMWACSAMLGWLPIIIFRRRGRVAEGQSYVKTTQLVTGGLYAVVRHPQYLALILIGLACACLVPHWATIAGAAVIFVATYASMLSEDSQLVEKFGDEYREYMHRVPRANLLWGLVKLAFRPSR